MARQPIDTPIELRKRIQKCNYSIGQLLREMEEYSETPHFIDWNGLVERLKTYRAELETELSDKMSAMVGKPVAKDIPTTPPASEDDEDFPDFPPSLDDDEDSAY